MKNTYFKYSYAIIIALIFSACETEDDLRDDIIAETPNPLTPVEITADPGSADFTKYVAVGNSLTAGLMDAALYTTGQSNSFPNLLAAQFALAGGGDFVQPDIDTERGFNIILNDITKPNQAIFGRFILDAAVPAPAPLLPGEDLALYTGPAVNNFGVPGARVVDLTVPQYGLETGGNYFYFRFASDPGNSTILGDALAAQGTFHTLWVGSNDVLGWISDGGNGPDGDVTPGAEINPSALTGTANFQAAFEGVLGALTAGGGKVIVLNIPNLLTTPLLQAVTWDRLVLDQTTADQLNAGFEGLNAALDGVAAIDPTSAEDAARRKVSYSEGNNPILAIDDSMEDFGPKYDQLEAAQLITSEERAALEPFRLSRPLTENDFVILLAAQTLGNEKVPGNPNTTIGVSLPITDDLIISPDEQLIAATRTATFNGIIEAAVAADDNAELVDANQLFDDIITAFVTSGGYNVNGQLLTPDFSPNGVFSVDAIHPNARGHGLIANEIIKVINEKFGATLPEVDVLNLPGITLK